MDAATAAAAANTVNSVLDIGKKLFGGGGPKPTIDVSPIGTPSPKPPSENIDIQGILKSAAPFMGKYKDVVAPGVALSNNIYDSFLKEKGL